MFFAMKVSDLFSVVEGKGTAEEPAVFVERLPGKFDELLHNPTYIYSLSGQDFYKGTKYDGEVVTDKKQHVKSVEHVEDVYNALEELERSGTVKIYRYPERPENIPLDNSDILEHMMSSENKRAYNLKIAGKILKYYPKLFPKVIKHLFTLERNNLAKGLENMLQRMNRKKSLPLGNGEKIIPEDEQAILNNGTDAQRF